MKKKFSIKTAKCLCGGIKIRITGKLRSVSNCHCNQCMSTHGNYAAYTACKKNEIKFLSKKTLKWYRSSNNAKRGFCNKCGASIFFQRYNSDFISISAGFFKNPTGLKSMRNIFIKGKLDYYTLDDKLLRYHRYP